MFLNFLLTAAQTQLNADGFCSPAVFPDFPPSPALSVIFPAAAKHGLNVVSGCAGRFATCICFLRDLNFLPKSLINARHQVIYALPSSGRGSAHFKTIQKAK